jgi:hypothetical protein
MIFAKIDVNMPHHYRLLDVRAESVRIPLGIRAESERLPSDVCVRIARAAALGVWTAALCYTRDHMLDGFCPMSAIEPFAVDEVVEELVRQGLFERAEREGRQGVVIVNYAKHNETKADINRRLKIDRARKNPDRSPRGGRADSVRIPSGFQKSSREIPPSESESESESETEPRRRSPSQAPGGPGSRSERVGEHRELVAYYSAVFERLKGVKPVVGARGGAGAKKLLQGRTLAEAKAIIDRALSDPWWLDRNPDLGAIAGKINSFIGRKAAPGEAPLVQPPGGTWRRAEPAK